MNTLSLTLGALALAASLVASGQSDAPAPSDAPAAGNATRGRQLAYTCLGCHGIPNYENAYPMYRVPKLAGQHADYIVSALQGYRDGDRAQATMHAQASSMSDADMRDIAAFIASGAPAAAAAGAEARGTAPAAGQVCTACHGVNGVGMSDQFPSLAGQYEDYIRRALTEYRQGGRKNALMVNFAGQLKDEDIAALAAYYSQQHSVLGTLPKPWSILAAK